MAFARTAVSAVPANDMTLGGYAVAGFVTGDTITELHAGKGLSLIHWDRILSQGKPLLGIASDNCHGADSVVFGGWVMVKAEGVEGSDFGSRGYLARSVGMRSSGSWLVWIDDHRLGSATTRSCFCW